jgi:DNA-binding HxlR family transcriptional regulator
MVNSAYDFVEICTCLSSRLAIPILLEIYHKPQSYTMLFVSIKKYYKQEAKGTYSYQLRRLHKLGLITKVSRHHIEARDYRLTPRGENITKIVKNIWQSNLPNFKQKKLLNKWVKCDWNMRLPIWECQQTNQIKQKGKKLQSLANVNTGANN